MFYVRRAGMASAGIAAGITAALCVGLSALPAMAQGPAPHPYGAAPTAPVLPARAADTSAPFWARQGDPYTAGLLLRAAHDADADGDAELARALRAAWHLMPESARTLSVTWPGRAPGAAMRGRWAAPDPESPGEPSPPSMDMPDYPKGDQPPVKNSDPCGEGSTNAAGCGAREGNQKEIEDCPPGQAGCLAKYATNGEATQTDLKSTASFVDELANKDRYASPQQASAQMCGIFSQHISFYRPDQYQFPPTTHNCLPGQSAQDNEQPTVTPVGTLTRLPSDQTP